MLLLTSRAARFYRPRQRLHVQQVFGRCNRLPRAIPCYRHVERPGSHYLARPGTDHAREIRWKVSLLL